MACLTISCQWPVAAKCCWGCLLCCCAGSVGRCGQQWRGEVLLGLLIVLLRRQRWPLWAAVAALTLLLVDVALIAPALLTQAFNPLSLNLATIVLCIIALRGRTAR